MSEELLRIENLSVDYKVSEGSLSAVHQVNLSINHGQVLALVGESGCGKSTVSHSIMRLSIEHNEKFSGKILFNGKNLLESSEQEMEQIRGKQIGMIFQNPLDALNPVYRTGTQVAEALRLDGFSKKAAREQAVCLFKEVQIPSPETRVDLFPSEMSGGMRQRVMIAMMLAREPQLLIADEPTTALDVTVEAQILRIMKESCEKRNAAVLLITHNFGLVAEIADRVGIMYAGELIEEGEVNEIFHNPSHPYTRALLATLPNCRKTDRRIEAIKGSVPRIIGNTAMCRFCNRCPDADEICRTVAPEKKIVGPGHTVYCHKR